MKDLVKKAVERQIEIIAEQQQKAQEFIDRKVCNCKNCKTCKTMPHLYHLFKNYLFSFNLSSLTQDDLTKLRSEYRLDVTKRLFRGQGETFQ